MENEKPPLSEDDRIPSVLTSKVPQQPETETIHRESVERMAIELLVPFLLAGFGMVAASCILDIVQYFPVYQNISQMYILVLALLGLKGNLEMTLASRLSTYANLGHFDNEQRKWSLITSNMALVLCQAVVVGFLASLAAVTFGCISTGNIQVNHAVILCASSVITAFCASLLMGLVTIAVVLFSRRCHINPDNVTTPIAGSLGDLTTLTILSVIASTFYSSVHTNTPLLWMLIILCLSTVPVCAWVASKNEFTQKVLLTGWSPVIFSMIISSAGGMVLNLSLSQFKGVAIFQLIINGVGGNLAAVQASRISTELHHVGCPGARTKDMVACVSPLRAFFEDSRYIHGKTARMLIIMAIPGHQVFCFIIGYLKAGETSVTLVFLIVYLFVAELQIFLLLYIAQVMTLTMWKNGVDPDNSAIPYLTALGDLIGTVLLGIAFQYLYLIGDRDSDVGD